MGGDYVLIGWLVLDATQSSSWVGIAFALYYLPNIIFGIIGGGIADRFPRRGLLQSLDFGAAGLIILFSVLFVYQTPQAPLVLVLTLVLGSLRAIKNPVRLALAYDLAGRQQATRALSGISVASRLGIADRRNCDRGTHRPFWRGSCPDTDGIDAYSSCGSAHRNTVKKSACCC